MDVTRRSPLTGSYNTRNIEALTVEDYTAWREGTRPIQEVLPTVSREDREFLISGLTPEEFESLFGHETLLDQENPDAIAPNPSEEAPTHE